RCRWYCWWLPPPALPAPPARPHRNMPSSTIASSICPSFHAGAGSIDAFPCAWHQASGQRRDALPRLVPSKCRAGDETIVLPHRSSNAGTGSKATCPKPGMFRPLRGATTRGIHSRLYLHQPWPETGSRASRVDSAAQAYRPASCLANDRALGPGGAPSHRHWPGQTHVNCAASWSTCPGQSRSSIRNHPVTDLLHVILLGIIEGITEFLPISSTGHLLIAEKFGLGARSDLFNIGIQAGAI